MSDEQTTSEIDRLEEYCEELAEAIDEFEHEVRRCRDRMERAGGPSHQLARDLKRLKDNRDRNRRELERARARINRINGVRLD